MIRAVLASLPILLVSVQPVRNNVVPDLARIGPVRVGFDTVEGLEKKLGPGKACWGGHPNGGRAWRVKGTRTRIYVDGFTGDGEGRVIDYITNTRLEVHGLAGRGTDWLIDIVRVGAPSLVPADVVMPTQQQLRQPIPTIRARLGEFKLLGRIAVGMSQKQVVALAIGKLAPVAVTRTEMKWRAGGYRQLTDTDAYKLWEGRVVFRNGRVAVLEVSVS